MNVYQIIFLVTCFLLVQFVFVWRRYHDHDFADLVVAVVCVLDAVIASIFVAATITWLYDHLGTLS